MTRAARWNFGEGKPIGGDSIRRMAGIIELIKQTSTPAIWLVAPFLRLTTYSNFWQHARMSAARGKLAHSSGFTLVELLVVLATIMVLALLMAPGLAGTRNSSDRYTCRNNLRQIGLGVQLYARDNTEVFPD